MLVFSLLFKKNNNTTINNLQHKSDELTGFLSKLSLPFCTQTR